MILQLLLVLALQDAPIGTEAEAAKLIDDVANKPDIYHQVCFSEGPSADLTYSICVAGPAPRFERQISSKQFSKLRILRDPAVKVLTDWAEKGMPCGKNGDWEDLGRTRLAMIIDLNATSTLPALRKAAAELKKTVDASPVADRVEWQKFTKLPPPEQNAVEEKRSASERLGDVVSTIIALLRQERFEAFVKSPLEKDAEVALAAKMKEKSTLVELDAIIRKDGTVPEDQRDVVCADPVTGTYAPLWAYPKQKIDAETFGKILAWADELAKRPTDKRRDAKGMSTWPVNR